MPCRCHPGEGGIAACGESVRECNEIPRTLGLTALLTTALPFEHALDLVEMLVAVLRSGDHEGEAGHLGVGEARCADSRHAVAPRPPLLAPSAMAESQGVEEGKAAATFSEANRWPIMAASHLRGWLLLDFSTP